MITHVVAMADNQVIGIDNKLPWNIPEDLKHFKNVTMNQIVVMGSNTFRSIVSYSKSSPILPGRSVIVITSEAEKLKDEIPLEDSYMYLSKKDFDFILKSSEKRNFLIIGGSQLFCAYPPDKIILTRVHLSVEGDTKYAQDLSQYKIVESSEVFTSTAGPQYHIEVRVKE